VPRIGSGVELGRLIELSNDLCCVLTQHGVFEYVNPAWERVLGWSPQELVGRHAFELIHPDDTARSRELGSDDVFNFQNRYQHKDGSWRTLLWSATIAGGRWYAIAKNLTGQEEAADTRRFRDDRLYRAIVEQTTQGIWALDAEDRTLFVNRYMADMLGYRPEEMIGRGYYDFLDPEQAALARESMQRRRALVAELREARLTRKDGSLLYVLTEASPLVDERGEYVGALAMVTDITERRRSQMQLALLAAVVESSSDAVIACSLDGAVRSWNPAAERMFGYSAKEMAGRALSTILPSGDESLLTLVDSAARGEFAGPVEIDTTAKDGSSIPAELTAFPVNSGGGRVSGIAVTLRDVRERRDAERRLEEHRSLMLNIERAGRLGSWEWVVDDHLVYWSDEAYRIHGLERTGPTVDPAALRAAIHPDDRPRVREAADRAVRELTPFESRYRVIHPNGEIRYVDARALPTRATEEGRDRRMTGTMQDVTELVIAEETARAARAELRRQALHDSLTTLPNRTLFLDRLAVALAHGARTGAAVAVIMVGLDRFALVNEELGHALGDQVLRAVAQRLVGVMRGGDTVGRMSGDEFAIVCEDVQPSQHAVDTLAGRVVDAFGEPFRVDGRDVFLTASAGVAWTEEGERADGLILRAAAALGAAKERERGSYVVAARTGRPYAGYGRLAMRNALREALEEGQLRVVYQPIVDLADRTTHALEALVRWEHPGLGPVSPLEFVPVAEDTGLINPIGQFVLGEATRTVAAMDGKVCVSVNLSPRQLLQQDLVPVVRGALRDSGLEPERLILELTESILVEESEWIGRTLAELKTLGVRLALDDFGTGYSALGYLKRFPLDIVKVDRSFVNGLGRDEGDSAIVGAVLGMATALGLQVVAEGVETAEQLDCLLDLGAHYAQGFYFARPCSPELLDGELGEKETDRTARKRG
jgi:diguanylate cyclase (GGDEF)-like protein/PAS domain S-box-containing protein